MDMDQHAKAKYWGATAQGYNAKRYTQPKWWTEDRLLKDFLSDMPPGIIVVDIPVGTGRFIPFYNERGFLVRGYDASPDMLAEAQKEVNGGHVFLRHGDITAIDLRDNSCDVAVAIRILRYLSEESVVKALKELQRIATQRVIFNARVANHPIARPISLIESALDGWKITRTAEIEPDYLMLMLEPGGDDGG